MAAITRAESKRTVSAIKEGWVDKKGPKSYCSFRRRYIILWSSKRIEYYTDDTLEKLKGVIDLKPLHRRFIQRSDKIPKTKKKKNLSKKLSFRHLKRKASVSSTDDEHERQVSSTKHYGFKIITDKRTWYLSVNDANARDEWIQTIRNTIDELPTTTTTCTPSTEPLSLQSAPSSTAHNTIVHQPVSLKSTINKLKTQNTAKWNQLVHQQQTDEHGHKVHTNQLQPVNQHEDRSPPPHLVHHQPTPNDINTVFPPQKQHESDSTPRANGNILCNQSTKNDAIFAIADTNPHQIEYDDDTSSLLHESDSDFTSSSEYETEPGETLPRTHNAENMPPNQAQADEHKEDEFQEHVHTQVFIERIQSNTPPNETPSDHTHHPYVHQQQQHQTQSLTVSPGACTQQTRYPFDQEAEGSRSHLGCSLSTTPRLSPIDSPNGNLQSAHKSESYSEWSDFWDLESAKRSRYIELSDTVLNAIRCTKSKSTEWLSCFGTKHVQMQMCGGQKREAEKQWNLRILPRTDRSKHGQIANVVVGVCEVGLVTNGESRRFGGFWMHPKYVGYGFAGYSGKKLDGNKRNQAYGGKYRVGDVVRVKLQSNGLLSFRCNEREYGVAFKVDVSKEYVLALAFCNDHYDVQIFD